MTDEAFRFSSDMVGPTFYRRWLPQLTDHSAVSDTEWIDSLVELWSDRYRYLYPDAELVSTVSAGVTFLLDVHLPTASARTVAAVARLTTPDHAREKHYQAGYPLLQRGDRPLDRGHLIPNSGGGTYGPNLFPQDRALNQGLSRDGLRFRALERKAVHERGLYFCALLYCDDTEFPAVVESGVLGVACPLLDVYRNRFDATAWGAFPSGADAFAELDAFLDAATTVQIGNLGEEAARSFLETVRDEVIVELDDSGLPRSRAKRGIDIVAVDRGALVAYEVKARLRSGRRRTRSGDLVRPRLTRSAGFRQASQHYVLERLGDILDEIDDETAVDVHVLVVDLHDRVLQQFGVDDEGRVLGPETPIVDVAEQVLDALETMLGWADQPPTRW